MCRSGYGPCRTVAAFLIRLLDRLQKLGTVPAIEYDVYSKVFRQ